MQMFIQSIQRTACACAVALYSITATAAVIPASDLEISGVSARKITIIGIREGVTLSGDVEIPASIRFMDGSKPIDMPVVAIGSESQFLDYHDYTATPAFYNQPGITSVTIPASVERIGGREFLGCTGIESFTVKEGNPTYYVENGALMCEGSNGHKMVFKMPPATRKTWFTVPKDGETAPWAFADVKSIKKIRFYGWSSEMLPLFGNTSVSEFEIAEASDYYTVRNGIVYSTDPEKEDGSKYEILVRVPPSKYVGGTFKIPSEVRILSDYCMAQCRFEYVDFGTAPLMLGTTEYATSPFGEGVFRGSSLREVTLPANMTLGKGYGSPHAMFMDCKFLEKAVINMPLAETGQRMFEGCTSLSSVTLPKNTKIATLAFQGCTALRQLDATGKPTEDSEGQFANSGLTSFSMSQLWKSVPFDMFKGCKDLKTVKIGSNVTEILGWAFYRSGLTSIDTRNVDYIGSNTFAECPDLRKIVLPDNGNTLYLDYNAFTVPEGCRIYIDRKDMRSGTPWGESDEYWPYMFNIDADAKPVIYSSILAPSQFIGDYATLYIPGGSRGYKLWPGERQEMYRYVLSVTPGLKDASVGTLTLDVTPLIPGVEITEVKINDNYGRRNPETGIYESHFAEPVNGNFPVTVQYKVDGVTMTTTYPPSFNMKVIDNTTSINAVDMNGTTITVDGNTARFPTEARWEVLNTAGQPVLSGTAPTADLSPLPAGIYIARQASTTLKFTKP